MTAFPKFSVERNAENVQIFEDTAKENAYWQLYQRLKLANSLLNLP